MSELQHNDSTLAAVHESFPVVGIGASAGGLEAFKRLIGAIPTNSGIAFILVQHLEPTHESLLADLLQRLTSIKVKEIVDNIEVEPDHIYIIPSNRLLTVHDDRLQLSPRPSSNEKNMSIDKFLTSLAEVYQGRAIGVVLSGTGADGTNGLKEIKDHGGLTFAQDPASAAYDSMPQNAIDAEVVDFILAPEDIPPHLIRLTKTLINGVPDTRLDVQKAKEDAFREMLYHLRIRKGTDFTYYKQTTIRRRIIRRMGLNKKESIADYLAYFKENKQEQDLLYQDLLIPVTGFFRDPKTYEILCKSVFPLLLTKKEQASALRIWVAGCATGEEPYSIAICLHEYLGDSTPDTKIQIFASDISEKSIARARSGIYSKRDIAHLSKERLNKYFTRINGSFQVNKPIRDMCVFATHNFLKDPPFAKMDLISCRNVLIYMETFLQKRALTTFHYALNENGYLLLGKSETIAPAAALFTTFRKTDKLYTRRAGPARLFHLPAERTHKSDNDRSTLAGKTPLRDDFQKSADEILLTRYTPSGVVVNEQLEIVQFRRSTGAWLEPPPGKPSLNILKMAREGMAFELRNLLHKAKTSNKTEIKEHVQLTTGGRHQRVTIEVIPLPDTTEPHFLVLFKDSLPLAETSGNTGTADLQEEYGAGEGNAEKRYIRQLESELAQLREDMRSITEDQEAVNEELQSSNEELLSGSEELQSLNEELETSKEEIQSTNEELTTLNQELIDRNEQLNLSRLYAESIVATIREPLLVLDKEMKVKTANRAYYKKFGVSEEYTEGKLLYALDKRQWDIPELRLMLDSIRSENNKINDFEITYVSDTGAERILLLNASRILREDYAELMILLAIEDVTETRKREEDMKVFSRELERQVEERTLSLKEANNALQYSNDNLEQFATLASHDLQEPLRKIRTFSAVLNKRYSQDIAGEAKDLLQKIEMSAERMSMLIHDVLNFSKVLDANIFVDTDLNGVLDNVIADFDLLIHEKKASIHRSQLPVIKAVPLQMNQLFLNLVSNALKFSKTEIPPVIDISYRTLSPEEIQKHPNLIPEKTYAGITISDNGIGFDAQFSDQIFLIFHRLHPNERFDGTGIGLALCQKIITNHKGSIRAESDGHNGAAFHVILPFEQ